LVHNEARILSRPLRVHWAGWETNTLALQQNGWQLNAEQDVWQNQIRLSMRHSGMNLHAMSNRMDFDFHAAAHSDLQYLRALPFFVMSVMGRDVHIHEHGSLDWSAMKPIDAAPTLTTHKVSRMEDLVHFAAPMVRTKEIIIPDESVPELLDRILKLQQPARTDRIREQMRNPEGMIIDAIPKQKFHAQIISLAA
jgi:hypothetical protein